jgi:cellulase/cellobiase CelA1
MSAPKGMQLFEGSTLVLGEKTVDVVDEPTPTPTPVPTPTPTPVPTPTPTPVPTPTPTPVPTPTPTPVPTPTPTPVPTPTPTPVPTPTPIGDGPSVEYTVNNWGSGYQVLIKVKNEGTSSVNGWTVKVNKKDVTIDNSWCVSVKEAGNYYVITPMDWNANIAPGNSVEFGIQGVGSVGNVIDITVE